MKENSSGQDTYGVDLRGIFKSECKEHEHYFSERDDVRQRLYVLLSNCYGLPQKCSRLVEELISCTEKTMIPTAKISLDLMSVLTSKAERIASVPDSYEFRELKAVSFKKRCPPPYTRLLLLNYCSSMKSKGVAKTYGRIRKKVGFQHSMRTVLPEPISDSSSTVDLPKDKAAGSNLFTASKKRRRTSQEAVYEIEHEVQSYVQRAKLVSSFVEIFILVGNEAHGKTLAKHMGLVWFDSFLEGIENIDRSLNKHEYAFYHAAQEGILQKRMNGYSNVCITTSETAWQLAPAYVKAHIYTKDEEDALQRLQNRANYCVLVKNHILAYIEAVSKIIQKSLVCNVLIEANYQMTERTYTKVHLPITVLIPLYIARDFSQSYIATRGHTSNRNCLDIFAPPIYRDLF